jgi:hypothetical protein
MGNPQDAARDPEERPSFGDPNDPRWSHNPHAAPPRNPYLEMPLDAPPIGRGNGPGRAGVAGQGGQNGYQQPGYQQQGQAQTGYRQPGYPVQAKRPAGVLAIVSLVAGIIGVFTGGMLFFPQLAAVICGHLALRREPHMRGVAIAGLVTGYLGLLFTVLLMVAVVFLGSAVAPYID